MNQKADLESVMHELVVHQTELEAQNRELRESREALEASRARFSDLFDFAPVGYLTLDKAVNVVEVNLMAASLLGYERVRILGKPLRALVRLDPPDAMAHHLHECMSRRETIKTEVSYVRKADEAYRTVQVISSPVIGADGAPSGCRTALVDVTERKRMEREHALVIERERSAQRDLQMAHAVVEQASRLKDEFLSTVSHELRTPLNAILGCAHMLTSMPSMEQEKVSQGLQTIRRNAEAQQRLVEDILDVSRMITGQLRVDLEPARLEATIRRAIETVTPTAQARRVKLTLRAESDPRVMADHDRMQQVVWNLLSNALKFTPADGRVDVTLEQQGSVVRIRVVDTGAGIEASALPGIFERFRQGDSSPSRLYGGLGLGLAIVRHLVDLHGGRVWGESDGAGKGSTFVIELPGANADAGVTVPPPPRSEKVLSARERPHAPRSLVGIHVLVVEDNEDSRILAAAALEAAGATVSVAASAAEALVALERQIPHVLVSDVAMPGESGNSLISKIRRMPSPIAKIPAIAVTAHARPEDAEASLAAGFDEYLTKPITPEALAESVARLAKAARR